MIQQCIIGRDKMVFPINYLVYSRKYLAKITETNQVREYNTMHDSLGFMVYNNHPCPQAPPLNSGGY